MLTLGLDYATDRVVDFLLLDHISNGDLRLAGISAPLSEEPARLLGILASIAGIAWWMRRKAIRPDSLRLDGRAPWALIFGMNAGVAFAIAETITNGDPLVAIISRAMAHGTYASLLMLALAWRRRQGATWPLIGAVALAMVVHGIVNALRAVDQGLAGAYVLVYGFIIVLIAAILAARLKPEVFGDWAFDLDRPEGPEA